MEVMNPDWQIIRDRYIKMIETADKDIKDCLKYRIECIDELINSETYIIPVSNVTINPPYRYNEEIDEIV